MLPTRRSFAAPFLAAALALSCARAAVPPDLGDRAWASPLAAALAQVASELAADAPVRVEWSPSPLVASDSEAGAWVARWAPLLRRVPPALLSAYVAANRVPARGTLPAMLGRRRVREVAPATAPDDPAERYLLTMPGLSAGGDSALVFVSRRCGPLCGSTAVLLLTRDASGWRVASPLFHAVH